MSLAVIYSRAQVGIDAPEVSVEVHLANGLPCLSTVGLPEATVKESKDRVRGALLTSQFEFPARRITINLAPADLPKEGGRFDLPIALGILAASGQVPKDQLDQYEFVGELALGGELRPVRGVLPVALKARNAGRTLVVPIENADEAALVSGARILPAKNLLEVTAHLHGSRLLAAHTPIIDARPVQSELDLADVYGQHLAKRALEVAAAGGHSLIILWLFIYYTVMYTENMKKKAYSYIRMSTEIQLKGDSLTRQLKLSEDYAINHNLELIDAMQDIGISAFKGLHVEKGALGTFLQACNEGSIEEGSYLLVESLDRISREDPYKAFGIFSEIINAGIIIVTLSDDQIFTKESLAKNSGQIFITLGSMVRAHQESEMKSQRLSAAWLRKRENLKKNNKKITSKCPAWLKYNNSIDDFTLIDKNVSIVKDIFKLNSDGLGKLAIAKMFNQQHIPSLSNVKNSSKKWNPSYIDKILKNRSVIGEFQPHKMQDSKRIPDGPAIKDYFPPIIDEDIFYSGQKIRSERRNKGGNKQSNKYKNIFFGIIKCGGCGSNISFRNKGSSSKGGLYLICSSSLYDKGCTAPAWRYHEFEAYFFKFINDIDYNEIFKPKERATQTQKLKVKIDAAVQNISEKETNIQNLIGQLAEIGNETTKTRVLKTIESLELEINEIISNKKANEDELNSLSQDINSLKHDITNVIKEINNLKSDTEVVNARLKLNTLLRNSIEYVTLTNEPLLRLNDNGSKIFIEPWESRDFLSDKAIEELKDKGIISDKQLEKFIMMDKGQRFYDFTKRSFLVKFKYGHSKFIIPYDEFITKSPVFKQQP